MIPDRLDAALNRLPAAIADRARDSCIELATGRDLARLPEPILDTLPKLIAASRFASDLLLRRPELLETLHQPCAMLGAQPGQGQVPTSLAECASLQDLKRILREVRQQEMLRLAWRDLAELDELNTTLEGLSQLADALVDGALHWLEQRHAERHGQPVDTNGQPVQLVVLGMGKLGGRELNFSSDIDLIFAYREAGQTAGPRPVSHEKYFRGLAQQLVGVLNEHTEHGFVFRVDTRLRPFGDSGPLVMNFDAMEQYYQSHGREWERYAWIKARPIAGAIADGRALLERLRPFVYRRYLDYGVYDALRDMKAMIQRETRRKGMQNNIKLGRGGIREIEFIAQVYQLIRGGQDVELQDRSLRRVLGMLAERGLLPAEVVHELDAAYVFLRRLENRLQAYADRQTHDLPDAPHQQASLALAMGHADWSALASEIERVRDTVYRHFQRVFGQSDSNNHEESSGLSRLWRGELDAEKARAVLLDLGYDEPGQALDELETLRSSRRVQNLRESARLRLNECMPLLLEAAASTSTPTMVLQRLLRLVQTLLGRTTYLALLVENPTAIPLLARLCASSSWIADQLQQHPMLLDNLLDPRQLYDPPRRDALEQDLLRQLGQLAALDLERQMDCMRRFKQAAVLRVAAADISEAVPLMVVSDHLTEIAEVVVTHTLRAIQQQLIERHGRPMRADGSEAGFAVIAYGKFGGLELGYGSDLDLVFVHDGETSGMTDGERPLLHEVYFNRVGQRLMHFLSAYTPAGRAYEVDMRLRPNGESGLLVPGFEALAIYQHEQAWTWEHQALVRARPVAGSPDLGQRFMSLRQTVLAKRRDADKLRQEVMEMREKMRSNLEQRQAGLFDLKQGHGGITDIEFIAQYCVLRHTGEYPELARFTDNIRIFEGLGACGLWPAADVEGLCDAYRTLRSAIHRQSLLSEPSLVPESQFKTEIDRVRAAWDHHIASPAMGE